MTIKTTEKISLPLKEHRFNSAIKHIPEPLDQSLKAIVPFLSQVLSEKEPAEFLKTERKNKVNIFIPDL